MNKPILTAATVATGLDLALYTPKTVTAAYTVEGAGYTSKPVLPHEGTIPIRGKYPYALEQPCASGYAMHQVAA
ncbi:MAG: hypothetical protein ABI947_12830 [Chloroflexota bacterium]